MTIQAHAEDADINVLMRRYGITGMMPENPDQVAAAMWGTNMLDNPITDFRSAVEAVKNAHNGFMLFPAELRARFENDPGKFIDYAMDPKNLEELRKFNLAKPLPAPFQVSKDTQAIIDAIKPGKTEPAPST